MGKKESHDVFAPYRDDLDYQAYYLLAGLSEQIAEKIRQARLARGWSQKQLADKLGTKQSLVSRLENPAYGKYSLFTLAKIAAALECRLLVNLETQPAARD